MSYFAKPLEQSNIEATAKLKLRLSPEVERDCRELMDMLSYCRPHRSRSEKKFIKRFLKSLGLEEDMIGNLHKKIGDAPILWSCHTDTVHRVGGRQTIDVVGHDLELPRKSPSTCLGADDTAGVWLMVQMIRAKVPGTYVFHRGEEVGCIGSEWLAKNSVDWLKTFEYAVALDRKGRTSVITHQRCMRCCSDAFAKSLAAQLLPTFAPDDGGVYTDTAEYVDLIGECTNLSVGYDGAHTSAESLDADFLFRLRDKLIALDVSKLERKRKPGEREERSYSGGYRGWSSYMDDDDERWLTGEAYAAPGHPANSNGGVVKIDAGSSTATARGFRDDVEAEATMPHGTSIEDIVFHNTEMCAAILEDHGWTAQELYQFIYNMNGFVEGC